MDTSVAYRLEALEKFMEAVAQMLGCLPSYCDSHPDRGNAHIIEKLRYLISKSNDPKKPTPPRYDEVYVRGRKWLNTL